MNCRWVKNGQTLWGTQVSHIKKTTQWTRRAKMSMEVFATGMLRATGCSEHVKQQSKVQGQWSGWGKGISFVENFHNTCEFFTIHFHTHDNHTFHFHDVPWGDGGGAPSELQDTPALLWRSGHSSIQSFMDRDIPNTFSIRTRQLPRTGACE